MADLFRKKDPCTTYKREGKTKQNVYQCLPSGTVEYVAGCPDTSVRDVYECCPPTPMELRCSVCWTAERDSCNIWTCVPFVSYSVLCGPTLGDIIIYILNLLPLSFLACLGIAHPRCCSAKPKPCVKPCPEKPPPCPSPCPPACPPACPPPCPPPRCVPVNRCDPCPVKRCGPCAPTYVDRRDGKNCGPCTGRYNRDPGLLEAGDALGYGKEDRMMAWMRDEYEALARELAEIKRLTNDDNDNVDSDRDLLQARNYVLDRLAEMLAKREEIQKRMEKKKHS